MTAIGRVLVTGGAGFIGSAIVDRLRAEGLDAVVLDNLDPAAHRSRPTYLRDDVRYVWADVRDRSAWDQALAGVDAVCHQAGKVGLGVDFGDVGDYVSANDVGLATGLLALHEQGFCGRIVLASSMVVYGEGRYRCATHGIVRPLPRTESAMRAGRFEPNCPTCQDELAAEPIGEDAAPDPRNVYAATKLHQEHLLAAFLREHPAVSGVSLRYHNVYGPRMPRGTPYAGVASIFRSAMTDGKAPQVTEDGRQRRNFVHVSDVAAANLIALRHDAVGAFNVAAANSTTIGEMAYALAAASGAQQGDDRWPQITGAFRLGDVRHVFASPARAEQVLGFRASIAITDGMDTLATDELRDPVL
jgi:dTDP-L-rhamnose 4-epimerase